MLRGSDESEWTNKEKMKERKDERKVEIEGKKKETEESMNLKQPGREVYY